MKKVILISLIASSMMVAGGDIGADVERIIQNPMPVASGWDFDGNAVFYYQTVVDGTNTIFSNASAHNNAGLQLRATNKDIFLGIGTGIELTALSTFGAISDGNMQTAGVYTDNIGGALTQGYLTYSIFNTNIKVGRQQLPKSLSPFAFTENWAPLKNTFDSALFVNSSIPNTTLVYAYVTKANSSFGDLATFNDLNGNDGIHMVTAQNKSINGLTLTGSYYYGANFADNNLGLNTANPLSIVWGDARYKISDYTVAFQGGSMMDNDFSSNTLAYGAKISADYGIFDTSIAYSSVDAGDTSSSRLGGLTNTGGVKTPLYTQMILNQNVIRKDSQTIVARVGTKALGGKFNLAVDYSTNGVNAINSATKTGATPVAVNDTYIESDLTYTTQATKNTKLFAGYMYAKPSNAQDATSVLRVWAKYNFK